MVAEIISKRCSKCKEIKPLSEFFKDRRAKDGIQGVCKSCIKAFQQSEKGRAATRKASTKYRKSFKGKTNQKAYNQSVRGRSVVAKYKQTPKGKAVSHKATAKFNAHHPNYVKAHNAVNGAVRYGRLPRPDSLRCHYCPKPAQQYHHWHGYEPACWLDVVPACVECHNKENKKIA